MRLYLVSLGLVGAVIITAFAIASFPSLYTVHEMQTRSGTVDTGEAISVRPDLPPATDANIAPVKLDTSAPEPDTPVLPPPAPPQSPPPPETLMPEAGPSQPAGQPSLSQEEAAQPKPEPAQNSAAPTPPSSGEAPDRLFRDVAIQHPPAKPGRNTAVLGARATAPTVRDSQSYEYRLRTNTAFRNSRLKKECGPITDAALHRHCVASFNLQYRTR
jgi:hypothetical protein